MRETIENDTCHKSVLSACSVFSQPMTPFQIQFLNAVGDLLDLIPALSDTENSTQDALKRYDQGHCSALIKVRHTTFLFFHTDFFHMTPKYVNISSLLRLYRSAHGLLYCGF